MGRRRGNQEEVERKGRRRGGGCKEQRRDEKKVGGDGEEKDSGRGDGRRAGGGRWLLGGEGAHFLERVMDGGQSHVFARLIAVSIFRRFSCVTHDNNGGRAGVEDGRGRGGGGRPRVMPQTDALSTALLCKL